MRLEPLISHSGILMSGKDSILVLFMKGKESVRESGPLLHTRYLSNMAFKDYEEIVDKCWDNQLNLESLHAYFT
jgi:hypothetical protein